MIIQVIGFPGSGKTEFAQKLADEIGANYLTVSEEQIKIINNHKDLESKFIEIANQLKILIDILKNEDKHLIIDFINPNFQTRNIVGQPDKTIWMNKKPQTEYPLVDALWEIPVKADLMFDDMINLDQALRITMIDFKLKQLENNLINTTR